MSSDGPHGQRGRPHRRERVRLPHATHPCASGRRTHAMHPMQEALATLRNMAAAAPACENGRGSSGCSWHKHKKRPSCHTSGGGGGRTQRQVYSYSLLVLLRVGVVADDLLRLCPLDFRRLVQLAGSCALPLLLLQLLPASRNRRHAGAGAAAWAAWLMLCTYLCNMLYVCVAEHARSRTTRVRAACKQVPYPCGHAIPRQARSSTAPHSACSTAEVVAA